MTNDGPAAPAAPAEGRRQRRFGKLLVIVLAFLVALGAVAGGALLFLYDRATAIDRSTPHVVTDQFLDAALVLEDPNRVLLFICEDWSVEAALTQVEAPDDPRVVVSWGDSAILIDGNEATAVVDVRFTIRATGGLYEDVQTWTLQLQDEDGWRVCGVNKEDSFEP